MNNQTTNMLRPIGRLEDSFSLPENQKKLPEDLYVEDENHKLEKRWHEKLVSCREMERKLDMKIC